MSVPPNPPSPESPLSAGGLSSGQTVGGDRYVLKKVLGQGGMGVVWLAHDKRLREFAALKFLPNQIASDPASLEHLRRETLRSRKLSHPNIVRIHDLYEARNELTFISMEYVDGPDLHYLRARRPSRVLSWSYLLPLLRQLCAALDYAHGERVIHRDLKPANLMLDSNGRLKLADFGLAGIVHDSITRAAGPTGPGGTLQYMSPQQADGHKPQLSDDIYALGATLYELLTSRPPFYTGDIPYQVRNTRPQALEERLADLELNNEIPSKTSALVMACLAKDPAQRPPNARAILEWLDASEHQATAPIPESAPAVTAPPVSAPTPLLAAAPPPADPPVVHRAPRVKHVEPSDSAVEPQPEEVPLSSTFAAPASTQRHRALVSGFTGLLVIGLGAGIWYWTAQTRSGTKPAVPATAEVGEERSPAETSSTSHPLLRTLTSHNGIVNSVAFSADGTVLASGSEDKTARIWNAKTGTVRQTITGHNGVVYSVALTPDGGLLATGSQDKTIKLWNAQTGGFVRNFAGHEGQVFMVKFSADGKTLFSAGEDKTIRIWKTQSGTLQKTLGDHAGTVGAIALSPDGRTLASGSTDQAVKLWDLRSGGLKQTLTGHQGDVLSVAFSPDGTLLASAARDHSVIFWEAQAGSLRHRIEWKHNVALALAFSPDSRTLACGTELKPFDLLDVETRKVQKALRGHRGTVQAVDFSPDGKMLASGGHDTTIKLWSMQDGKRARTAISEGFATVLLFCYSRDSSATP